MCRSASHRHLSAPSSADHVRPRKRCRHPISTAERFTTASFVRGTLPAHAAATTSVCYSSSKPDQPAVTSSTKATIFLRFLMSVVRKSESVMSSVCEKGRKSSKLQRFSS